MNSKVKLGKCIMVCVLSMAILIPYPSSAISSDNKETIIVKIDYGNIRPSRTIETSWEEGNTALEILQKVAEVKTHPVDEYVFVVSIDGVEGKRGEMGWYYSINGKSADKLAYSKILNEADYVQWVYKKDVCSEKVDKK